jgi:hypothetical protein
LTERASGVMLLLAAQGSMDRFDWYWY